MPPTTVAVTPAPAPAADGDGSQSRGSKKGQARASKVFVLGQTQEVEGGKATEEKDVKGEGAEAGAQSPAAEGKKGRGKKKKAADDALKEVMNAYIENPTPAAQPPIPPREKKLPFYRTRKCM
jgi:hypothetical protein